KIADLNALGRERAVGRRRRRERRTAARQTKNVRVAAQLETAERWSFVLHWPFDGHPPAQAKSCRDGNRDVVDVGIANLNGDEARRASTARSHDQVLA